MINHKRYVKKKQNKTYKPVTYCGKELRELTGDESTKTFWVDVTCELCLIMKGNRI